MRDWGTGKENMRKRAVTIAASFALASSILLAHAAFAVPLSEQTGSKGGNEASATSALQGKGRSKGRAGGTEAVRTCNGGSMKLRDEEKRTLELHNETRRKHRLKPLCVDPALSRAARAHSESMIEGGYFSHASKDGQTPGGRLKRSGYDWETYGENIAWGSGSYSKPESIFKRWMKSPGHRKNVLEKSFREVGIGIAGGEHEGKGGQAFYSVDFGTRRR